MKTEIEARTQLSRLFDVDIDVHVTVTDHLDWVVSHGGASGGRILGSVSHGCVVQCLSHNSDALVGSEKVKFISSAKWNEGGVSRHFWGVLAVLHVKVKRESSIESEGSEDTDTLYALVTPCIKRTGSSVYDVSFDAIPGIVLQMDSNVRRVMSLSNVCGSGGLFLYGRKEGYPSRRA